MNTFAKGMRAQRERQAGTSVSSTEQYVTQVSVPNLIAEIRARAKAAGGVTEGQSIREQMAAEAELERLAQRHIAARRAEADRTGPGPSPADEMEFRTRVPELHRIVMQQDAARNGQASPDETAIASHVQETFRQVEGSIANTQQALQSLEKTVTPNVDLASLRETDSLLDSILKKLGQIGPAIQSAGSGISSRSFGRHFESRQSGSFSDFEHR